MRRITSLSLVVCLGLLVAGQRSAPAAPLLKHLSALTAHGARVSALVIDISHDKIITQMTPDQRLTPASVSKLFTTAAVLKHWGPNYHFDTRLLADGPVEDGVVHGDLIMLGGGDPALSNKQLWVLAARLRQAGVHTVTGDLVINNSLFGPVTCVSKDRCRAHGEASESYDSPLSAVGTNFNAVELTIMPANQVGKSARLALMPPDLAGFRIHGHVTTAAAGTRARYSVRRVTTAAGSGLYVGGHVPVGSGPYRIFRAVSHPALYAGNVLSRALASNRIRVHGGVRVDTQPAGDDWRTLAEVESPALVRMLRGMMTYSNNYMADMLTLGLQADLDPDAPLGLASAADQLSQLARRANAFAWPSRADPGPGPIMNSGSGLTVSNRLSARDLVSLLKYMYAQSAVFPAFMGTLPVPLYSPMHMLKNGNGDWTTRIAAKTGSLSQPVSVMALAGYMRLKDNGWGAFAMIVNGSQARRHVGFYKALGAIRKDLQRVLARY